jgi:hypothetical protein
MSESLSFYPVTAKNGFGQTDLLARTYAAPSFTIGATLIALGSLFGTVLLSGKPLVAVLESFDVFRWPHHKESVGPAARPGGIG